MKTDTFFSFKFAVLAIILTGALTSNSFATIDTIMFGGSAKTFRPNSLNVKVGDTIIWLGYFGAADPYHRLQSEVIPANAETFGPITMGQSFTYVVKVAGTYNYECLNHCCGTLGNMQGVFTAASADVHQTSSPIVSLGSNFPNPSSGSTIFTYTLASPSQVNLKIFDLNGKELRQLVNAYQNSGNYEVTFDASALPSGSYMYQLQAGDAILSKKMVIAR